MPARAIAVSPLGPGTSKLRSETRFRSGMLSAMQSAIMNAAWPYMHPWMASLLGWRACSLGGANSSRLACFSNGRPPRPHRRCRPRQCGGNKNAMTGASGEVSPCTPASTLVESVDRTRQARRALIRSLGDHLGSDTRVWRPGPSGPGILRTARFREPDELM
jgi:hypothetical protein